jgi:chromosome segregation protein
LKKLTERMHEARRAHGGGSDTAMQALQGQVREIEGKLGDVRKKHEEIARELGRAEGALQAMDVTVEQIVAVPHVRQFAREISESIEHAQTKDDMQTVRRILGDVRERIRAFVDGLTGAAPLTNEEVRQQVQQLGKNLESTEEEEKRLAAEAENTRQKIAQARDASYAAEREAVSLEGSVREAHSKLSSAQSARANLASLRQRFEEEVRESIALIGSAVHGWEKAEIPEGALHEDDRAAQEKRRRDIERLKIKIEESGTGNADAVVTEFTQTKERDEFLAKELIDLERSAASLQDIIVELEKTIDGRFTEGLKEINVALENFFNKLFGGGHAKLFIEEPRRGKRSVDEDDEEEAVVEEEDLYAGLSIDVSLPRKKIRGLEVLSGGERALTSIALIFSMTQVNPPPFLILDETDAALDEANSKRYADMIRELGAKSQLIVITHNRSTMAAAGELYGVTMSSDGVSKLLSVKLEEAERVAK